MWQKRLLDIVGSTLVLGAATPILAATALAIRVSEGSPVLFRQIRPGRGGRPFTLLKFRTMRTPRPGEDPLTSDSDRLSPLGEFLRRTSIDELPSLINVLKGEMSLVGPRPLLMEYLDRYSSEQARRHEVKPGVTGLAQVRGRNSLSWDEKFAMDLEYVENRSLRLDLRILAETLAAVLAQRDVSHAKHATMPEFLGSQPERVNEPG